MNLLKLIDTVAETEAAQFDCVNLCWRGNWLWRNVIDSVQHYWWARD